MHGSVHEAIKIVKFMAPVLGVQASRRGQYDHYFGYSKTVLKLKIFLNCTNLMFMHGVCIINKT